jgi:hypothetical protein
MTKALIPANALSGMLQLTNNKNGGAGQSPFDMAAKEDKIPWSKAFTKENRASLVR